MQLTYTHIHTHTHVHTMAGSKDLGEHYCRARRICRAMCFSLSLSRRGEKSEQSATTAFRGERWGETRENSPRGGFFSQERMRFSGERERGGTNFRLDKKKEQRMRKIVRWVVYLRGNVLLYYVEL